MENPLATIQRSFHSKVYQINIFVDDKKLELRVKENSNTWSGEYSVSFIETLTHKAGSLKKFNIFLNMLISALEGSSSSVVVDIESHNDLEKIRNKPVVGNSNTIYMILTYIAEFDKIYYPLPLHLKEVSPLTLQLQREISDLNRNLDTVNQENSELIDENIKLKQELESCKGLLNKEVSDKAKLAADFEMFKIEAFRESKSLQRSVEDLRKRLKIAELSSSDYLKKENSKLEFDKKILIADVKSLKLLNKKRKNKIEELQEQLHESKNSSKERSKSVINSSPETPCRASTASTRSRSTAKKPINTTEISVKLEKIVQLLSLS